MRSLSVLPFAHGFLAFALPLTVAMGLGAAPNIAHAAVAALVQNQLASGQSVIWASAMQASSQYGDTSWSAQQATLAPNTEACADTVTAWASRAADGTTEWLEAQYTQTINAAAALIVETFNPGAVSRVEARLADGTWRLVWSGFDPNRACPGVFRADFSGGPVQTNALRVTIDSARVPGWNEIDAVGLLVSSNTNSAPALGAGGRQWATNAVASSEYGNPSWAAAQATGMPNTTECGDRSTAWASRSPDGGAEWLEVTFARRMRAHGVVVLETYNPGAIVRVDALTSSGQWMTAWSGVDPNRACPGEAVLPFAQPVETAQVRLTLDSAAVTGWNELDAVALLAAPEVEPVAAAPVASNAAVASNTARRLAHPAKVVVVPLRARRDVDADVCQLLTGVLLSELAAVDGLQTISASDVETMLGVEKQKDMLGCDSNTCAADIGGALGADYTLHGEIGKIGTRFTINVSVIQVKSSSVVARLSKMVAQDEDALASELPNIVGEIVAKLNR